MYRFLAFWLIHYIGLVSREYTLNVVLEEKSNPDRVSKTLQRPVFVEGSLVRAETWCVILPLQANYVYQILLTNLAM